jgi:hypothetical protein
VLLRVDVDRFRAGGEVILYSCEMDAPGGTHIGAFYSDEIEPLE